MSSIHSCGIYNEDRILVSIQTSREQGKKIGLFIGRRPYEKLPEEEDTLWISLDCGIARLPTSSLYKDLEKIAPERLHLVMDFNKDLKKIAHLFDKVVVDQSTMKFLVGNVEEIISKLVSLLDNHFQKKGLLIFESDSEAHPRTSQEMIKQCSRQERELYNIQIENNKKPDIPSFYSYKKYLCNEDLSVFLSLYRFLPKEPESWDLRQERLNKKNILQRFFKDVSSEIYQPFPYPTRYCRGDSHFFVCSGLKYTHKPPSDPAELTTDSSTQQQIQTEKE